MARGKKRLPVPEWTQAVQARTHTRTASPALPDTYCDLYAAVLLRGTAAQTSAPAAQTSPPPLASLETHGHTQDGNKELPLVSLLVLTLLLMRRCGCWHPSNRAPSFRHLGPPRRTATTSNQPTGWSLRWPAHSPLLRRPAPPWNQQKGRSSTGSGSQGPQLLAAFEPICDFGVVNRFVLWV